MKTIFFAITILLLIITASLSMGNVFAQTSGPTFSPSALELSDDEPLNPIDSLKLDFSESIRNIKTGIAIPANASKLIKTNFKSEDEVEVTISNPEGYTLSVETKYGDEIVDLEATTEIVDGNTRIEFASGNSFKPGTYTLLVKDLTNNKIVSEQNFTWGVLAINTNKSIYTEFELAHLAIGVLDSSGHMVCDAKVKLEIRNPKSETTTLSTENGEIKINPVCASTEITTVPDYESEYKVGTEGIYQMKLTAESKSGTYTIYDSFEVRKDLAFDIERVAATRIYPPNTYPVNLKITFNQDYRGIITETVPESFGITYSAQNQVQPDITLEDVNENKKESSGGATESAKLEEVLSAADTATESAKTEEKEPEKEKADSVPELSFEEQNAVPPDVIETLFQRNQKISTPAQPTIKIGMPFEGEFRQTQGFGVDETDPLMAAKYEKYGLSAHDGLDYAIPMNTPIIAVDEGVVLRARENYDYGTTIIIEHSWGRSYYGHLNKLEVKEGDKVSRGQQIGLSGSTGLSTGPHLHFGIKPLEFDFLNGYYGKVDPKKYLNSTREVLGVSTKKDESIKINRKDITEKTKIISWRVTAKKGETITLGYSYKAPNESPAFYKLGPLTLQNEINEVIFTESRSWQIAGDALPENPVKIGNFTKLSTTGTQEIRGVGFKPKAVIFMWTQAANEGTNSNGDEASFGMGFTTGTSNERAVSNWSNTGNASDTGTYTSVTSMIVIQDGGAGTVLGVAELSSMDADGFTINWTTSGSVSPYIIRYIALSEELITDATVQTFSLPASAGNLDVGTAGFQPDFVMLLSGSTSTHGTDTAEASIMTGAAMSPGSEWVNTFRTEDAQGTANTCSRQSIVASVAFLAHDGGGNDCSNMDALADFTNFEPDGFDLNVSDAPAVARDVFYLALKGTNFHVNSLTAPTSPGTQTVSAPGFQPSGVFFSGWGKAANVAASLDSTPSYGAATPFNEGSVAFADTDGDGNPDPDTRSLDDGAYTEIETATPTVEAEADLIAVSSTGFTLNWTTVDETANEVLYWAVGGQPVFPKITMNGYIFENDDGTSVDTNTQQAATAGAVLNVKKGERITLREHITNTGIGTTSANLALFYDRNDNIWSLVGEGTASSSAYNSCGGGSALFDCTLVQANSGASESVGNYPSISFDPSGNAWISHYDVSDGDLWVSQYVGSGGNCDSVGGGSDAWSCTLVQANSGASEVVGAYSSISFDPGGNAWISHRDNTDGDLWLANYVGLNGNCDTVGGGSDAWNCTLVQANSGASESVGYDSSIAFDPSGAAWISHRDGSDFDLWLSNYVGSNGNCDTVGGGSDAWNCTLVQANSGASEQVGYDPSIAFDTSGAAWISHNDLTDGDLWLSNYVGSGGNCDSVGGGSDAWNCTLVQANSGASESVGESSSISFDPAGNAWISHHDFTDGDLWLTSYVGSGGNCDSVGGGSDSWNCTLVQANSGASENVGNYSSISFDPAGNAWISNQDNTDGDLWLSSYVGSGGNCDSVGGGSDAWNCTLVQANSGASEAVGQDSSIAFDFSGKAWISHRDNTDGDLWLARINRKNEITISPGLAGAGGASLSESHADMSTVSDTTNRDDADCLSGGIWNNGKWFETVEGSGVSVHKGSSVTQCTEVAWTLDTSQASAGTTYRFVLASKDNWRDDKGEWRGPVAINNYPTLTIESGTPSKIYSKDTQAKFTDCSTYGGSVSYGCDLVQANSGASETIGIYTSITLDPSGNPWISHRDATDGDLWVSNYVGSNGNCDSVGGGSDSWNCTLVQANSGASEIVGSNTSMAFDSSGAAWISHYDSTDGDLWLSNYVGSNGNCDSVGGGSDAWNCTLVQANSGASEIVGNYTSMAFDSSGAAWISHQDQTDGDLWLSQYVGSGGNCDGGAGGTGGASGGGSDAWNCTLVQANSGASENVGNYTSISFDPGGAAWISHRDGTDGDLWLSQYVGSGGNCDSVGGGSDSWNCTLVQANSGASESVGFYSSISFDPGGAAWISHQDSTDFDLWVSNYVGSNGNCDSVGGGSDSWNCTLVQANSGASEAVGYYSSISFDPGGAAWISHQDVSDGDLWLANYVGSGGNCDSVGGGSDSWNCTLVQANSGASESVGYHSSISFDSSGNAWISHHDENDGDLWLSKLHLPHYKNNLRYLLDRGDSSNPPAESCDASDNYEGYCGLISDNGEYDSITSLSTEYPIYNFATKNTDNVDHIIASWIGKSSVAASTQPLKLEVYKFGTTNAWVTMDTENSLSCTVSDCTLSGIISSQVTDYYQRVGSDYYIYWRVYQGTAAETLSTDAFTMQLGTLPTMELSLRHAGWFNDGVEQPFSL